MGLKSSSLLANTCICKLNLQSISVCSKAFGRKYYRTNIAVFHIHVVLSEIGQVQLKNVC